MHTPVGDVTTKDNCSRVSSDKAASYQPRTSALPKNRRLGTCDQECKPCAAPSHKEVTNTHGILFHRRYGAIWHHKLQPPLVKIIFQAWSQHPASLKPIRLVDVFNGYLCNKIPCNGAAVEPRTRRAFKRLVKCQQRHNSFITMTR